MAPANFEKLQLRFSAEANRQCHPPLNGRMIISSASDRDNLFVINYALGDKGNPLLNSPVSQNTNFVISVSDRDKILAVVLKNLS